MVTKKSRRIPGPRAGTPAGYRAGLGGQKIRSKGRGRGLGIGRGSGPVGGILGGPRRGRK